MDGNVGARPQTSKLAAHQQNCYASSRPADMKKSPHPRPSASAILALMRPHQYVKNGFVFVGPVFAHKWDAATLWHGLLVFAAFCLAASAVYIFNDLLDREADRAHPLKKTRPLASGRVTPGTAKILYAALVVPALLLAFQVSHWAAGFVATYLFINILYSLALKRIVILDVFTISAGFMLRILAGTVGLAIVPSAWLLLCGLMLTLFLGFSKRRAELLLLESDSVSAPGRDSAPGLFCSSAGPVHLCNGFVHDSCIWSVYRVAANHCAAW